MLHTLKMNTETKKIKPRISQDDYSILENGGNIDTIDNRSGMTVKVLVSKENTEHEQYSYERQALMTTEVKLGGIELPRGGFAAFEYTEDVQVIIRSVAQSDSGKVIVDAAPYTIEKGRLGRLELKFEPGTKGALKLYKPRLQPKDIGPDYLSIINKAQEFQGRIYYTIKAGSHIIIDNKPFPDKMVLEKVPNYYLATLYYSRDDNNEFIGNLPVKFDPSMSALIVVLTNNSVPRVILETKDLTRYEIV